MAHERQVAALALAIVDLQNDDVGAAVRNLESALKALKGQQTLPGVPPPVSDPGVVQRRREAAARIFSYWQQRCQHAAARLTSERGRVIIARLADGYSEAEIRKAIDGAAAAPYVNPDTGVKYDDLELICRNGTKLEGFIRRGEQVTGPIVVDPAAVGGDLESQIAALRRTMATMLKDGRQTEYTTAAEELRGLMARRTK